jgi:colicin import membrane protein
VWPEDSAGNLQATFEVTQNPVGEVLTARLLRSSGNPKYDEAVERAILKSSPLPRAEPSEIFQRVLTLNFRPNE